MPFAKLISLVLIRFDSLFSLFRKIIIIKTLKVSKLSSFDASFKYGSKYDIVECKNSRGAAKI